MIPSLLFVSVIQYNSTSHLSDTDTDIENDNQTHQIIYMSVFWEYNEMWNAQ